MSDQNKMVGQEFWFVATGCDKQGGESAEKERILTSMQQHPAVNPNFRNQRRGSPTEDCLWEFDAPDGARSLYFGSFDNLIRLTDDLSKFDSQLDTIIHRLERQYLELLPKAEFMVRSHGQWKTFESYFRSWKWDEAKYPRSRSISDTLGYLMQTINKLDEESRNKTAQLNDLRSQHTNLSKKDGLLLTNRDLIDVLTPEAVKMKGGGASPDDDFIYTEHLTTVVVILPRGAEQEFTKEYVNFVPSEDLPLVVPMSAKCFSNLTDKEGNSLWRVVMFKPAAEPFKKACREKRYIIRDFEYDEAVYKELCKQRTEIHGQVCRQFDLVKTLYAAAWSDAIVGMLHVKAMRIFVESVLRFGMPPKFAAFVVKPKTGAAVGTRRALAEILGEKGPFGADKMADAGGDDGEEYFPYVSFSFVPFTVPRS